MDETIVVLKEKDMVKDWRYYLRSVQQFLHKSRNLFLFLVLLALASFYLAENLYLYHFEDKDHPYAILRINKVTGYVQKFDAIENSWVNLDE
jgi:hypothetical protein